LVLGGGQKHLECLVLCLQFTESISLICDDALQFGQAIIESVYAGVGGNIRLDDLRGRNLRCCIRAAIPKRAALPVDDRIAGLLTGVLSCATHKDAVGRVPVAGNGITVAAPDLHVSAGVGVRDVDAGRGVLAC